jgi:hypothetical protein
MDNEIKAEQVVADLMELVLISHQNTVKTLKAFDALHRAANDLDALFEERYGNYLASGKTGRLQNQLTEIPAALIERLTATLHALRSKTALPEQGRSAQ